MTEILLLGTFHFLESSIDFYSDEIQKELGLLAQKLLQFNPDTIAVEATVSAQKSIDESYKKFNLSDLKNRDKMQNETLGEIYIFGQTCPITYNNESIQIGYRLGKLLELNKIYAIDDDTSIDMNALTSTSLLTKARNTLYTDMEKHTKDSIVDLYRYYNSARFSELSHSTYIQANAIKTNTDYIGAELVAKWYERNLKIFSNIQQLAQNGSKRLFIIYGAGHLQILKEFINADSNLKLVDVYNYL